MSLPFLQSVTPDLRRLVSPMRRFSSVNAWIFGSPGRQLIVDTGMCGAETEKLWRLAEEGGEIAGIEAILATHMHRDHVGQMPYLQQRFGAPLLMSAREHAHITAATEADPHHAGAQLRDFRLTLGIDAAAAGAAPIDYSMLAPFPQDFTAPEDNMEISLAGRGWRVMLGGGHSAEAACLLSEDESLFFSGDQILPGAGPHITVWPQAPDADPLADYFGFLDRLAAMPDTMLVLPGHGAPFTGLSGHAKTLRNGHEDRLAQLRTRVAGAMTCTEMAPLIFSERAAQRFSDLLPGMVLSLANHLWHRGEFRRHSDDDGVYRFEKIS